MGVVWGRVEENIDVGWGEKTSGGELVLIRSERGENVLEHGRVGGRKARVLRWKMFLWADKIFELKLGNSDFEVGKFSLKLGNFLTLKFGNFLTLELGNFWLLSWEIFWL